MKYRLSSPTIKAVESLSMFLVNTSFASDASGDESADDTADDFLHADVVGYQSAERVEIEAASFSDFVDVEFLPFVDVRTETVSLLVTLPRNRRFAAFLYIHRKVAVRIVPTTRVRDQRRIP